MNFKWGIILTGLLVGWWTATAAVAGVSVTSGLTYEKTAVPGGSYTGVIQLKNTRDAPQEVKVYPTDYLFYADGRNLYGDPGTAPRSNAGWVTFAPRRLVIPPKGTAQVDYAVAVPPDDTLAGTYWSMLMVEAVSTASPEAVKQQKDRISFGISQVMRHGLQMVTQIGDTGTRELKFVRTRFDKAKGRRILEVDVENTGRQWLKPALWVECYTAAGASAGRFEGGKSRIYPGTSVRFRADLSAVPPGEYKALVVADCGGDTLFGAAHTFRFRDAGAP